MPHTATTRASKVFGKDHNKGKGSGKDYGKHKGSGKEYGKGRGSGKGCGKRKGSFKDGGKFQSFGKGLAVFPGFCGGCWEWAHKKTFCPKRQARMDVGALSSASTARGASSAGFLASSAAIDPGTSASRVHVSAASQLQPVPEVANNDWTYDDAWRREDGDRPVECEDWSYDADGVADAWHDDEGDNFRTYGLHRAADDVEEILTGPPATPFAGRTSPRPTASTSQRNRGFGTSSSWKSSPTARRC